MKFGGYVIGALTAQESLVQFIKEDKVLEAKTAIKEITPNFYWFFFAPIALLFYLFALFFLAGYLSKVAAERDKDKVNVNQKQEAEKQ
jgi:hypothetical protein